MDPTDLKDPAFNPRNAALKSAIRVKDENLRHAVTAIVCGLLAVAESGDNVYSMLEQLDVTVHNQLHDLTEATS